MAEQFADAALIDTGMVHAAIDPPFAGVSSDPRLDDDRMTVARGVVTAVLIAAPFWAVIAFTVYLLM
jgi:hypothetical protein